MSQLMYQVWELVLAGWFFRKSSLAGSVGGKCYSWPWACGFELHIGYRDYVKLKTFIKDK